MSKSSVPILWAQRKDKLFLTVDVPEINKESLKVDITEDSITITATSPNKPVDVQLKLHGKVTSEGSKFAVHGKSTEFVILRAEEGEYWPRLLSDSTKYPWLRVDWGKWVDEDEEDEKDDMMGANPMMDMSSLMGGMGGMGGMPDFGAMGGMPDFGADDDDEDDEDDHEGHDHAQQ